MLVSVTRLRLQEIAVDGCRCFLLYAKRSMIAAPWSVGSKVKLAELFYRNDHAIRGTIERQPRRSDVLLSPAL